MTIKATIIADSISPAGIRLTTLQLRYPKFIHGEFMTHRVFSRNTKQYPTVLTKAAKLEVSGNNRIFTEILLVGYNIDNYYQGSVSKWPVR